MKDFKIEIVQAIVNIDGIKEAGLNEEDISALVVKTADSKNGDFAFPCFRLAKAMRKAPQAIATDFAEEISANLATDTSSIDRVEAVNAYVNFFLKRDVFVSEIISSVQKSAEKYGSSDLGEGKTVIVEFSSPNIAKPFHIGHIRSTVIGNSIEKIYSFLGYDTVRINHLGDYGTQFGKMIVAYRKWGNEGDVNREPINTLLAYYTKFHEEVENNPGLEDEAREVFVKLEQGNEEELKLWQWFRDVSLGEFNRVYKLLGISFDSYAGESFYSDKMARVTDELKEKGLLKESDGAMIVDLEEYNMSPALITKKDGSTLYITRDIAAAIYRKETYDFYKNIYVVASQQNLHFQQWFKIVELMGYDWAKDCIHIPFGLVSLSDGTMSTRQGRVVFLQDVLDTAVAKTKDIISEKMPAVDDVDDLARQIGIGSVIFNELSNNRIKDYVFSWGAITSFEGETGPYAQYAHARAASVLRREEISDDKELFSYDDYLSSDDAFELAKLLYEFPGVVAEAGAKYEPSIVTRHVTDMAQSFNRFYHNEHILVDDEKEKESKLALLKAFKQVIKNGLTLLGLETPERM